MISYDRLWSLLKEKNITKYRLHQYGFSNVTLEHLKKDQCVSTDTIDKLCAYLNCRVEDIMEYRDDS